MKRGLVSVIVLNWNGERFIGDCLASVFRQSYPDVEVIVIDNDSADGSPEVIRNLATRHSLRFIEHETNLGFSVAMNRGIEASHGEYVLLCNHDITLTSSYVSEVVKAIQRTERVGAVSGKLLLPDHGEARRLIDSTGIYLDYFRTPIERGQGEIDRGQHDEGIYIFCPSGALPLYRREMLEDARLGNDYLDGDFFAYYEDIDLGWRAQLLGWRALYCPKAVAYHYRGGANRLRGFSSRSYMTLPQREAIKNRYLMLVKNEDWGNIFLHLPFVLFYEAARLLYLLIRFRGTMGALVETARSLPSALRKRKIIRSKRRASAAQIRRFFFPRWSKSFRVSSS